ncbi:MAG: hypothetical protein JSU04_19580 [Bdellovibrionales bacterium]|nr:hypothetical protein [Bdellovibrionales bacterium]
MSQFHNNTAKSISTVAAALLALATIFAPKASLAISMPGDDSKPVLIKTGTFTRDQMRFEATIVSTGFICERGWDLPSDQSGNIVFDPDHCKNTGYSCAVILQTPFNDGTSRPVGIARHDYSADENTTDAACQKNIADFYNSLGSAPLHYSIYRVDENVRFISIPGVGEANYYFYSGK